MCYYSVMVRLINRNNLPAVASVVYSILKVQECMTFIANYNHPALKQCIYVMWHANQFLVHGIPNRPNLNILISNSLDGQIVANVCEKWGFRVKRGSSGNKGAVSSTLQLINSLKEGQSVAIMVDGPRGPYHKVKKGALILAKESGIPIVPVHWYSEQKTFRRLPSWDRMASPIGPCKILNIYGEPIYANDKTEQELAEEIESTLLNLEKREKEFYKKAVEQKLWSKK